MIPKKKSEEHLLAQVEIFADDGVREFSSEQKLLLQYSGELAKLDNLEELPEDFPAELKDLIDNNRQAYVRLLREAKREEIQLKKENAELYRTKFKSAIDSLKSKMSQENPKNLPEYLGSGSNGSAFKIVIDGKEYAAKFSRSVMQANFEIKPLLRAESVENVAQLIAYSFEDSVVIMNLLSGNEVDSFAPDEDPEYSDDDIRQLIDLVSELYEKGVVVDPKPSNFMYDSEAGFSVLDFHLRMSYSQSLADSIMDIRGVLCARAWPMLNYRASDYAQKAEIQRIERLKIYFPMMVRFLRILNDEYPDLLSAYKSAFAEREADPNIGQSPLIDRDNIPVDLPEFAKYLRELEELGF